MTSERSDLGGPSFVPLYASHRSRHLSESPDWLDRRDFPATVLADMGWARWADVVLDFRLPGLRDALPARFEDVDASEVCWGSDADGWSLEGWFWRTDPVDLVRREDAQGHQRRGDPSLFGKPLREGVSVMRFTDPEGFRFAVAVSHDQPEKPLRFASGRFSFLFPSLRYLLLSSREETSSLLSCSLGSDAGYSLEVLRDAIRDPDAWFGEALPEWRTTILTGPFRPIDPARALLAWASHRATTFTADVVAWVAAGMDPPEVAAWRAQNNAFGAKFDTDGEPLPSTVPEGFEPWTDTDIREWFTALGGGRNRRLVATRLRAAGLSPEQGARWDPMLNTTSADAIRRVVAGLEAAGWEPADVAALMLALNTEAWRTPCVRQDWLDDRRPALEDAAAWTFVSGQEAVAYVRAGIGISEARQFLEAGTPVDLETLQMLAALRARRPEPEPAF